MPGLDSLRILGFGNPLLDISAVVKDDVMAKYVHVLTSRSLFMILQLQQ